LNHHLHRKVGNFIQNFGVEALAARIGVHSSALYHWAGARVQLRQEHAQSLQSIASEQGVRLSLDEIYFLDDEGRAKLQSARERRKMGRTASSEGNGRESFGSVDDALDFARGSGSRLL